MLHHHKVEPSTTSSATGCSAVFSTDFLEVYTNVLDEFQCKPMATQRESSVAYVQLLGRERTTSNTSSICLDDTNGLPNHLGRDSETGADTTDSSRRRGDVWESSKVEVKHERIGTLDQDTFAVRDGFVDVRYRVDHIRL